MTRTSAFAPDAAAYIGFNGNRIDRQSENRPADALATAIAAENGRYFLFSGDCALIDISCDPVAPRFTKSAAREFYLVEETLILLGFDGDVPVLAAQIRNDPETLPDSHKLINMRTLARDGAVAAEDIGAMAQARSFLGWHDSHGHCAYCGERSVMMLAGHRRDCPACKRQHFPRTDPVVIMLTIDGDRCLLGRSGRFEDGMYSCLAGFMEPGETIENAVRRETLEESAIVVGAVRYHASQAWPFPSSLMIGCHGEALSTDITMDKAELEDCRWFSREEVQLMLDHTHPDGLVAPAKFAIAHEILLAFAEHRTQFDVATQQE